MSLPFSRMRVVASIANVCVVPSTRPIWIDVAPTDAISPWTKRIVRAPADVAANPQKAALWCFSCFGSLAEAEAGLLAFQDYYQQIATPFEWKFTTSDLDLLLKRLAAHEPAPAMAA